MKKNRSLIVQVSNKCPCICPGCYNVFSKFEIASCDIIAFVKNYCRLFDVSKVTLSGGDPLLRKDITKILEELLSSNICISLDTVGITLAKKTENESLVSLLREIDYMGIPLDGMTDYTIQEFRRGLSFNDFVKAIDVAVSNGISVCLNTVVHAKNIHEIMDMAEFLIDRGGIKKWQLFQYMPIGPGGLANKDYYSVSSTEFEKLKDDLQTVVKNKINTEFKSLQFRKNQYLLLGSDGVIWMPKQTVSLEWDQENDSNNQRTVLGTIYDDDIFEKIYEVIK